MFISPHFPYHFTDSRLGNADDCKLLREDKWLHNTEVRYYIRHWNSRWYVTIIFVVIDNPLQLVCRPLHSYESQKKALIYAQLFQRGIRKDARGILKVQKSKVIKDVIRICYN